MMLPAKHALTLVQQTLVFRVCNGQDLPRTLARQQSPAMLLVLLGEVVLLVGLKR